MATLDCCPVSILGAAPLLPRVPGVLTLETFLLPPPSQGEICPTELHPKPVGTAGVRRWRWTALHRPHLRAKPSARGTEQGRAERSEGGPAEGLAQGKWCFKRKERLWPSVWRSSFPPHSAYLTLFLSPSPLKAQPLSSAHPSVAELSSLPSRPRLYACMLGLP